MLTYESLRSFAATLDGQVLRTSAQQKRFTLNLLDNGFEYVPKSSNKPRRTTKEMVERALERYNESRSLAPGHYSDITVDASYLMRLIEMKIQADRQRS
jgi:hypothetical protein